jgi:magnesium chelatase family protein
MLLAAVRAGVRRAVVPLANAAEAALVPDVTVAAVDSLHRLVGFVRGGERLLDPPRRPPEPEPPGPDLADVVGQPLGRRAIEVAAAGNHHVAMVGPPGAGKTMLARRLPSILPPLDDEAALEVAALHSIAGLLPPGGPLRRRPPLQAPHHTASVASLVGGGAGLARPGAVSLAHRGVLFLDEAPEFGVRALEALRQPLEDGVVSLSRAQGRTDYPARVQLVLAANPCPCAKPVGDAACECPPLVRRRYLGRLSGPLRDRVDVQVHLDPLTGAALFDEQLVGEASARVAERVAAARAAAAARWAEGGWRSNAEVPGAALRSPRWRPPAGVLAPVRRLLDLGELSARGHDRVVRLAWTIADLAGRDRPGPEEVREAIELRRAEAP